MMFLVGIFREERRSMVDEKRVEIKDGVDFREEEQRVTKEAKDTCVEGRGANNVDTSGSGIGKVDARSSDIKGGDEERGSVKKGSKKKKIKEEKELEKAEEESLLVRYKRLAADYQNFKRRSQEEKLSSYSNAISAFAEDLLPVIDNFERAFLAVPESEEAKKIYDGMGMIYGQLEEVLKKNGIKEITAEGLELDPKLHHAVQVIKDDKREAGQIITVVQKGYKKGDKLIRPAMVTVAE
jgi:molecular chaperone GrpE